MNKQISELTYKIVAFPEVQQFDINESVDWAIEMMELGQESPTLYILAGFRKPVNYFEVIGYVKKAIAELGFEMKNGDDATLSYASYYIHQIVNGEKIRDNLTKLYKFCQMRGYEGLVYDFYLLFWAWDDLDYEDSGNNHYWEGARRNNIEMIIVTEAKKWIEKNKIHYEQN